MSQRDAERGQGLQRETQKIEKEIEMYTETQRVTETERREMEREALRYPDRASLCHPGTSGLQ